MATHTVFGNGAPAYPIAVYNDGFGITLANVFYLTNGNGPVSGWRSTGGRVYIPNNPSVTNKSITIMAWAGHGLSTFSIAFDTLREVTTMTPAGGGWCEVTWDEPFDMDYGPTYAWVAIGYKFNGAAEKSNYIASAPENAGPHVADFPSNTAGLSLVMAHSDEPGYIEWGDRGAFLIEGETINSSSNLWYGADIIVDTGPSTPYAPTAAYGFNEASGMVAFDASGNARNLPLDNANSYGLDGHSGAGLRQYSSTSYALYVDMPWISTPANPVLSVMFWGMRETEGSLSDSWTVRQTVFNGSNVAWGVKMSNGTNSVIELFIQGFTVTIAQPKKPVGQWNHYCFVTNGYFIRYYIDGVLMNEVGANGMLGSSGGDNDQNLVIYGGDMQGQVIDDLRIFDKTLSAADVLFYMNQDIVFNNRSGKVKVWNGSSWQAHPLKVWDGTSWVVKPVAGSPDGVQQVFGKN